MQHGLPALRVSGLHQRAADDETEQILLAEQGQASGREAREIQKKKG